MPKEPEIKKEFRWEGGKPIIVAKPIGRKHRWDNDIVKRFAKKYPRFWGISVFSSTILGAFAGFVLILQLLGFLQ